MYQTHWGLSKSPFRGGLDPQFFYESPTHEEALARLYFLVEQHRRVGLLMGSSGSGKSLLLELLAEGLYREGKAVAKVDLLGVEPAELLYLLTAGFGVNPDPTDSIARLWRTLTDRLAEYRFEQREAVVLLDDADQAGKGIPEQITRLAQHDASPESRLTIVLAGRHERMGRLGEGLLDLAELRIDVEPWKAPDTAGFLSTSLARAGRRSPIFDEPAVTRLHELSHGIPRRVSRLADLSLLAAAGKELEHIDADVVESAYRELGPIGV